MKPFSRENELLSSTVYRLTPSFYRLFLGQGKDKFFDYQISALTQEQYAAVTEFLRHIIDDDSDVFYQYDAARAIRWGWSQKPTPARLASQAFYHHLYNYTYPQAKNNSNRILMAHIKKAFARTPMPTEERLTESEQTDEPYENSLEFQGAIWSKLHPDFIRVHSSALAFFTPAAFRYYLPAYLMTTLQRGDDNVNPIFYLVRGFTEDSSHHRERCITRMSLFSEEERYAIVAYLESHLIYQDQKAEIEEALQSYWKKKP